MKQKIKIYYYYQIDIVVLQVRGKNPADNLHWNRAGEVGQGMHCNVISSSSSVLKTEQNDVKIVN